MTNKKLIKELSETHLGGYYFTGRVKGSDMIAVFWQSVSSHPWKKRAYEPRFVGSLTKSEVGIAEAMTASRKADEKLKAAHAAYAAKKREDWIQSLPDQLDEETLIDKRAGIVTDSLGNYLMSLPKTPVEDIRDFVDENYVIPE